MRIAQIASIAERVPAKKYGGSERIVYTLTEELVRRGHDVTLFASGDSITSAKLSSVVPYSLREMDVKDPYHLNEWTLTHIGMAYGQQDKFDIIHDHIYNISMPTAHLSRTPVLSTVHSMFHHENIPLYQAMKNVNLVTISNSQRPKNIDLNIVGTVYHGLNMKHYPFGRKSDGYLLFCGRMSMEKGVHFAIEAAQKLDLPLKIIARVADYELDYFKTYVKPHLSDPRLEFIGEVDEDKRNTLMAGAIAILHPVTWPEPFGLTMIESMACGTPVVAFNQGSIPEVVEDKKTGFVVRNVNEMVAAVKRIGTISRAYCRNYALTRFTASKMAAGYEAIYEQILAQKTHTRHVAIPRFTSRTPVQVVEDFMFSPDFS